MNNGIKRKLQELIGKNVDASFLSGSLYVTYPGNGGIILRIENDDCVVVKTEKQGMLYVSIDNIAYIKTDL